jgi:hypothetical protein
LHAYTAFRWGLSGTITLAIRNPERLRAPPALIPRDQCLTGSPPLDKNCRPLQRPQRIKPTEGRPKRKRTAKVLYKESQEDREDAVYLGFIKLNTMLSQPRQTNSEVYSYYTHVLQYNVRRNQGHASDGTSTAIPASIEPNLPVENIYLAESTCPQFIPVCSISPQHRSRPKS